LAWGFKIQSIGNGDYYGFTVDGNQRMLLEDMTVTHNTTFIHHRINKYLIAGKECLVIKYAQDTRYSGANELSTHDGKKIAAVSAERIADIPLHMFEKADVIAIDEV
jgi:thymidine kinase